LSQALSYPARNAFATWQHLPFALRAGMEGGMTRENREEDEKR